MKIVSYRRWYFVFSGLLVAGSIVALATWGLRFGIDFTGGSLWEVRFPAGAPENAAIEEKLGGILESLTIQRSSDETLVLRFRDVPEAKHQEALGKLKELGDIEELRFDSIGPTVGAELKRSGVIAVALGLLAIAIYIAWAFRKAARPISSWQYGAVTAAVALFHDVLIPLGAFSLFGKIWGMEVNTPFIAPILTVLGFSVHDTIVVFDRVRENLRRFAGEPFPEIVERSVHQTFIRSLNTSLTVLFAVSAVWYFGGTAIAPFAATLFVGIAAGTYSSIFIASMGLVEIQGVLRRRRR